MRLKTMSLAAPLLIGVLTAAAPLTTKPECEQAASWVKKYAGKLPSNLLDISGYTRAYRRAIYNALPLATQRHLWHEQFGYYGASEALTTAQRDFVHEMDSALDEYFAPDKVDAFEIRFKARAVEILGAPRARDILANLGVNTPEERQLGQSYLMDDPPPTENCACSTQSDWCSAGMNCVAAACNEQTGCGTFWAYLCGGLCRLPT